MRPHRQQPTRLPSPWDSPGKNTGVGCRKGRRTNDQLANILWTIEKVREVQKNIYFCFIVYAKAFDCVNPTNCGKILRTRNTRPPDLPPKKPVCRSRSNKKLEVDIEQETGSKWGKEYVKGVYCHPAYLTYMQSTS